MNKYLINNILNIVYYQNNANPFVEVDVFALIHFYLRIFCANK